MRFSLVTWYQMHPYVFLIWNILPLKTLIGTTTTTFKILIWCANNTLSQGEIAKWNKKNSLYEFKNISWNQLTFWFYGFQYHYQHFPVKSLFLQIHSVENSSKPRSLFLRENNIFIIKSTFLKKKSLKSWFHGNFWARSRFIVLWKNDKFCATQFFSSNQFTVKFFRRALIWRKKLRNCASKIPWFPHTLWSTMWKLWNFR